MPPCLGIGGQENRSPQQEGQEEAGHALEDPVHRRAFSSAQEGLHSVQKGGGEGVMTLVRVGEALVQQSAGVPDGLAQTVL